MKVAIHQPNYLPWLGVFSMIRNVDCYVFYDDVQYTKNDWRNRNRIKGPDGTQWLTIPVQASTQHNINEVLLPRGNWRERHLKSISMAYARAKYCEDVMGIVQGCLMTTTLFLSELSQNLTKTICDYLEFPNIDMPCSSDIGYSNLNSTDRLVAICKELGATEYHTAAAAKDYLEIDRFDIPVVFQDYKHPTYPQLWGDFVSHMSIVDALCNCGVETKELL